MAGGTRAARARSSSARGRRKGEEGEGAGSSDEDDEGGSAAWAGTRVAHGVSGRRSWLTWTRLGLCVWMIPPLVVMIISISQLILIKVIITWVVTGQDRPTGVWHLRGRG